jgi:hypothetical protein
MIPAVGLALVGPVPVFHSLRKLALGALLSRMWAGSCKCLSRLGNLHMQLYDLQADMLCICIRVCFWMQVDLQAVVRVHVFGC